MSDACFDPNYYVMVHNDVAESGMNPFDHFKQFGKHEGRSGVPPGKYHPLDREMYQRFDFISKAFSAVSVNGIEGDYAEFGVGTGKTFWAAWQASHQLGRTTHLWAFDSFEGLPPPQHSVDKAHSAWRPGRYAVPEQVFRHNCRELGIPDDEFTVVPGWFSETLTRSTGLPREIAIAYVDCDLYGSTKEVLSYLRPVLSPGAIVAFDDWFCWSTESISGEARAFGEFQSEAKEFEFHPYQPFGWHGFSFYCVKRLLSTRRRPFRIPHGRWSRPGMNI